MSEQSTHAPASEQPQVEYRDIPGHPGYRVGSDGSVWSCRLMGRRVGVSGKWKRLRTPLNSHGYPAVKLCLSRRQWTFSVHTLVLLAFVGPCPDGMETRHLNGVRADSRLDNLAYGTPAENYADRVRHGTTSRGEQSASAKLTEAIVRAIRKEYVSGGVSQYELARRYGVHQTKISAIILRTRWAHVEDE